MLNIKTTHQFEKDYKKIFKSGNKHLDKLKTIMVRLANNEALEPKHKDHLLKGNYKGHRECHIEPDWLLIYKIEANSIIFERTGNHSELFE